MAEEYYKKIDFSIFKYGLIIPKKHVPYFETYTNLKKGESKDVKIIWGKKKYNAKVLIPNRKDGNNVCHLRWDNNKELLQKLCKTFIQSYVIFKSQKELYDKSEQKKIFRSTVNSGQQEVMIIRSLNEYEIEIEEFIKIENGWNTLFERLVENNVFDFVFQNNDEEKQYLIQKSHSWMKTKEFPKHKDNINVIYYLANTKEKTLYIGKADNFGRRVKPGRNHQGMEGNWDLFRFDIVRPEFANILTRIEDHTIRAFAGILRNKKNFPSLDISNYTLVNSQWKKL